MNHFKLLQPPQNPFQVLHVATGRGPMDEISRQVNTLATGDGVVFMDVDSLHESDCQAARDLISVLPEDFDGVVYLTI